MRIVLAGTDPESGISAFTREDLVRLAHPSRRTVKLLYNLPDEDIMPRTVLYLYFNRSSPFIVLRSSLVAYFYVGKFEAQI